MKTLYPACEPYAVHRISLEEPHELHVEECGNPRGIPVIFLHGGPGSGCAAEHRRYFDPTAYRIVLFDQRGSGKSTPAGEISRNRTPDIVSDMEVIRRHLAIDRWMLFGGSWGATLALLYALSYPDKICGIILRGTFLARASDMHWFFVGLRRIFPQAWQRFSEVIPDSSDLQSLIDGYYARLHGTDLGLSLQAARRWSEWSRHAVNWHRTLSGEATDSKPESEAERARLLAKVGIETHYAHHRYFIGENEILENIASLPAVPVSIVHGRYDLTCTLEAAWQLHKAIPGSRLIQVAQAGHLIEEPAMAAALIEETDRMQGLL
jgi:proline iminopeptidase